MKNSLVVCFLIIPIFKTQTILFPLVFTDANSSITISFSQLQAQLTSSPTEDFCIVSCYYFETNISLVTASIPILPIFEINQNAPQIDSKYHKNYSKGSDYLEINNYFHKFRSSFINTNDTYTNKTFLCFNLSYLTTDSSSNAIYRVSVVGFMKRYNSSNEGSGFVKYKIMDSMNITLQDIQLKLNSMNTSEIRTKIYQTKIYKNTSSSDLFSDHDYENIFEIFYQIRFNQEPSRSKLLYNRSKYVFPPAINGEFSEKNTELHSFYSTSLKKTFWVAYDSFSPKFIQLPKRLISNIYSEYFNIKFYIDFYILTESSSYASSHDKLYNYPLISFFDEHNNEFFSIRHYYRDINWISGSQYTIFFKFFVKEFEENTFAIIINDFYKTSNIFFRIKFKKKNINSTLVTVYYGKTNANVKMFTYDFSNNLEPFHQIILGKKSEGMSSGPLFAYFFKSFHVFLNDFDVFQPSSQSFEAYLDNDLAPYHSQTNPNFWFFPDTSIEVTGYISKMSGNNFPDIVFNQFSCPSNCEICFNSGTCDVCRPWYVLNSSNLCELGNTEVGNFYNMSARNKIYENDKDFSGSSITGLNFHPNHHMLLQFENDATNSQITSTDEKYCQMLDNDSNVIADVINWNFNNLSSSPFVDYSQAEENNFDMIKVKARFGLDVINSGNCILKSDFKIYLYHAVCMSKYTNSASLKGYLGLKFCKNTYIDIDQKRNMIVPKFYKSIQDDEYAMRIPDTESYVYGFCKNFCKCFDGDIDKNQNYNSCFFNEKIGNICDAGFTLLSLTLDNFRQKCYSNSYLILYQFQLEKECDLGCAKCINQNGCSNCIEKQFNTNFINKEEEFVYCNQCNSNCYSCSGPEETMCICRKDQFGILNTRFLSEFNLCLPTVNCPKNCELCGENNVCIQCRKNYYFDDNVNYCVFKNFKNCVWSDIYGRCFECSLDKYLLSGRCVNCPNNCKLCLNEFCSVCHDGYLKDNGKCLSFISLAFFKNIDIKIQALLNPVNLAYTISLLNYKMSKFFLLEKSKLISLETYENLLENKDIKFKNKREYYVFLDYFTTYCTFLDLNGGSFLNTCTFDKKNHSIVRIFSNVDQLNLSTLNTENCEEYKTKKICKQCKNNYIWNSDTKICVSFKDFNALTAKREKISGKIIPSTCKDEYYFNSKTKKCQKNLYKCTLMNANGRCKRCLSNFVLDQSRYNCISCSSFCESCSLQNICIKCQTGYYLLFDPGINFFLIQRIEIIFLQTLSRYLSNMPFG